MGKNNTLGDRIKSRRQVLGFSQSELSKQLNCTQAALSQYENGNREPGLNDLAHIACCLQTTTDYLLGLTDIASNEREIQVIGDYLGLTEESINKLHMLFMEVKAKTSEQEIVKETKFLSGRTPDTDGYEYDYNFIKSSAYLDLEDHMRIINEFICSQEFSIFISRIKHNLFLQRNIYDILRIVAKQYNDIESPVLTSNVAEIAYSLSIDSENDIQRYSLNLFDAQNALIDFCRNFTQLEEIKKLDYSKAFYKKLHFFLFLCTKQMGESGNYSVETMEKYFSENIEFLMPTITEILSKREQAKGSL